MKNKLFGRGVFNRTSKVSNMTPDRLAGGGFTLFGLMCVRMSPHFFTRGYRRGAVGCRSFNITVLCVLVIVFTLSSIFSTHAGAQELPIVELRSSSDRGVSNSDGITYLQGSSELSFTLCTPFAGGSSVGSTSRTHQLEITNPSGAKSTEDSSVWIGSSGGTCTLSGIPFFPINNEFGTTAIPNEGVYKIRGRANSSAEWGPFFYLVLDHTDPTLNVFVSAADGTTQRTAAANAYDLGGGVYKFEVVNGHTGACDAAGTRNATFADYEVTRLTVSANTEACFRVTDFTNNVSYGSTNGATVVSNTTPPASPIIQRLTSIYDSRFQNVDFRNNNDFPASNNSSVLGTRIQIDSNPTSVRPDAQTYLISPDRTRTRTGVQAAGGETSHFWQTVADQPLFPLEGVYTLSVTLSASNLESPRVPVRFLIDRTAPVIDIRTSSATASDARTVTATATDAHDRVENFGIKDTESNGSCSQFGSNYDDYTGTVVTLASNVAKCFFAEDRAGNKLFLKTSEATELGNTSTDFTNNNYIGAITYLNADDSASAPGNLLNDPVQIKTITVPSTPYRIYIRPVGGSWPSVTSASVRGGTSGADGSITSSGFTLPGDGIYEVSFQIQESGSSSSYLPSSLAPLSTFTVDTTDPDVTVTKTSGGDDTEARVYTATATDTNGVSLEVVTDVAVASCTAVGTASETFSAYTADDDHNVAANQHSCFKVTDGAGNVVYKSTAISGIASITYKNSDNTAAATGNLLKSRTFTVEGTTTASTEYRIFVRAKDGAWPGTATASGSSAANGSVTQSITLNADGDYELATQIKVGSEYLPGTLAVNSEFTIDTTAPAINNPALVSDNSNDTSLAMEGDDLTLTFTVSETLTSAPSVTIAGQTVTATESSGTYTATVTVSSSTDEGAVTYDIGVLTDTAGNTFNHTETTSSVIVDLIAPTLTIVQTAGTGTAERTVTAFASDTNGVTGLEVADDESTCSHLATNTFGNYTQNTPRTVQATTQDCFKATDNAGNVRYTSTLNAITGVGGITYTHSDNTAAATGNLLKTSAFTIAGTTATTTNYRLFVRAKDSSWPATATASGTSAANGTLSQTLTRTDGDYETAFQIQVGNSFVPALASLVATSTFSIDSSPPTFTLNYSGSPTIVNNTGYYNTSTLSTGGVTVSNITETALATAVLTLARTDTTGIPNLTPTPTVNTDTNTVSFANLIVVANGTYTATVTLTDDAGNQTTKTLTLVVDTATPSITAVTIDTPSARRSVEALITVTHGQTFQETLTATLSGQNCTTLNPITLTGSTTSTTAIQLRGRTGTFTCTITLTDQAGNTSSSFTIPSFTIKRSSSGGGGGVRPGSRVEAPSFNVPVASVTPTQPTDRQERIALLKLALNRILERIQYLLAQKTNG